MTKRGYCLSVLAVFFCGQLFAVSNEWVSGSGNWDRAEAWSLNHVPTAEEDVLIPGGEVLLDESAAAYSVEVSGGILSAASGASLAVTNTLTIADGAVNVFGGSLYFDQRVLDASGAARLNVYDGRMNVRGIVLDNGGEVSVEGGELHIFGTNNNQLQLTNGSSFHLSGDGVFAWHWGNKVAMIAGFVAAGSFAWSDPGTTMQFSVWDQSWTNSEGNVLYAYNDGGIVYAWTSSIDVLTLRIDCSAAEFPPLVQKFHGGSFFLRDDNDANDWIDANGALQMPVYRANIREARENYADNKTLASWLGNDPADAGNPRGLLYLDGTNVMPNFDLSLDHLRGKVADYSMINYIRWDGVPYLVTDSLDDNLFRAPVNYAREADHPSDWNPPPHEEDRLAYTQAMGRFIEYLNLNESDFRPTIWSFWQEPDHTLGDPNVAFNDITNGVVSETEKQENVRMLVRDLYRRLAKEVRAADPDYMVSGIAQNSAAAEWDSANLDPDGPQIGGARLGHTIDEWLIQESTYGETYPLDYFSLQLYQGDDMEEYHIPNSRYALKNLVSIIHPEVLNRFDRTPVFITEYNYVKLNEDWNYTNKFNLDDAKFREVTENWVYMLSQPDLAYATLQDLPNEYSQFRSTRWLEAYSDMPELRVAVTSADDVQAMASMDPDQGFYAFIWNSSSNALSRIVQVDHLAFDPATAVFFRCVLDDSDNGIWEAVSPTVLDEAKWVVDLAASQVWFMAVNNNAAYVPGDRVRSRKVLSATYGSHNVLVPRIDAQETDRFGRLVPPRPKGMGHYDQIDGRLVVGVEDSDGVGLAGVVLRDAPDDYLLRIDFKKLGVISGSVRLRVDYLDGESALKSVVIHEAQFDGAADFGSVNWFAPAAQTVSNHWNFLESGSVMLPVGSWKPSGWQTADDGRRRVRISLLLADVPQAASLVASLSDQSSYAKVVPQLNAAAPVLQWRTVSDAEYTVWSTENLRENFQTLESGLTGNSYTGSVSAVSPSIFYKVTVDE